ncbi:hypothetical protein MATL_G00121910 [Megalops atlanticus]|uniref:Uncharacterized protein n=1 Tax=Megalops atlanticus TaxID=7932 RepID=A0A9D3Q2H9_MEGAT|nr:hypothetical protein MATL_G00121910 [Megalops atlanticus]
MSRSLRLSNKQSRRSRHASSGKVEHRNSETSTRSSSTPSIPQSLADNGLEPFNETDVLPDFGSPIWVDRVAMNLRPVSFHNDLAEPSVDMDAVLVAASVPGVQAGQDGGVYTGDVTYLQRTSDGPRESVSFKKKRSKSADMWREDSLEFSLSDLSQEHLTSTEEIIDTADEKDFVDCGGRLQSSPEGLDPLDAGDRSNSLDELYDQKSPARRVTRNRFTKYSHEGGRVTGQGNNGKMLSPPEDDGNTYGAYTLPCRRSHCLSEGLPSQQMALCTSMQGRRAQTTQDVTAGEGSEYGDSGIDGVTAETEHQSRRYKTMSASFSVCSAAGVFAGSDSGSSSGGGGGRAGEAAQGVYENFRQELEMSSCQT